MSSNNKVVWSDGLFLKPHHFQQQARYAERHALRLATGSDGYNYGFQKLVLNEELLGLGKIALVQATGIMPDGTPFDIPAEDLSPAVLDLSDGMAANELIYLCMPLSVDGGVESQESRGEGSRVGARFSVSEIDIRDNTIQAGELSTVKVAKASPILMTGRGDLSAFSKLVVAKVADTTADGAVVIDKNFYPTMLSISSAPALLRVLADLVEGVSQRAESIAGRIGKPDQNGVADVSDFLLLQALNRYTPLLRHYKRMTVLHPEEIYRLFIQITGELATFISESKLAPDLSAYDHDRPDRCWPQLVQLLRQLVSATLVANAVPIACERKLHGYIVAPVPERDLIKTSEFVLAVKANVSQERLQREFPALSKVSSIETIRDLVAKQLPGIPIHLMPVAPRQLPYHAGYSYFGLDKKSVAWSAMMNAEGFGFHLAGDFPELEIQFWAIKE